MKWSILVLCLGGLLAQINLSSSTYMAEALMLEGLGAQKRGNSERAMQLYQRAASWSTADPQLRYLQGHHWNRLGQPNKAKAAYASSLDISPNMSVTLIKYAELLALTGDPAAAQQMIDHALQLAPADPRAQEIAGLVLGVQGDHAGAALHFEKAVELSVKPSPKLLNHASYALFKLTDYDRALKYVDEALRKDPSHPDNHLLRGKILMAMKRSDDAVTALRTAEREFLSRVANNASTREKLKETRSYLARLRSIRKSTGHSAESLD